MQGEDGEQQLQHAPLDEDADVLQGDAQRVDRQIDAGPDDVHLVVDGDFPVEMGQHVGEGRQSDLNLYIINPFTFCIYKRNLYIN